MNGFKRICAVIIGMVLLIAGILKMMDPVGSGLVMDEYLKFFHLGFLKPASQFVACALALVESLLGAALIAGVWRKVIALASGGLLAFFTLITVILILIHSIDIIIKTFIGSILKFVFKLIIYLFGFYICKLIYKIRITLISELGQKSCYSLIVCRLLTFLYILKSIDLVLCVFIAH